MQGVWNGCSGFSSFRVDQGSRLKSIAKTIARRRTKLHKQDLNFSLSQGVQAQVPSVQRADQAHKHTSSITHKSEQTCLCVGNHQVTDERTGAAEKFCLHNCGAPSIDRFPSGGSRSKRIKVRASPDGHPSWTECVEYTDYALKSITISADLRDITRSARHRHPRRGARYSGYIVWLLHLTSHYGKRRISRVLQESSWTFTSVSLF